MESLFSKTLYINVTVNVSILSTSNSTNNLFKLFKESVAFPLPVLRTGREIIILHSGLLILIYDVSDGKLLFYTQDHWF